MNTFACLLILGGFMMKPKMTLGYFPGQPEKRRLGRQLSSPQPCEGVTPKGGSVKGETREKQVTPSGCVGRK